MSIDKLRIHTSTYRLIALTFIPNLENLPQINHIDDNKLNNHVTNLEWIDNSGNQIHAYRLGLQPYRRKLKPTLV